MFRLSMALILVGSVVARAESVSPRDVQGAVERGVTWLYSQQNKDTGSWERVPQRDPAEKPWSENGPQWGRTTGYVTYALLCAGESPADPRIAKAVEFLQKAELIGVYPISMRISVLAKLPRTPETQVLIAEDAKRLLAAAKTSGPGRGLHNYLQGTDTNFNALTSTYAASGIWTAGVFGLEIPIAYWKNSSEAWIRNQDPSGGWGSGLPSQKDHAVTSLMTVSGLAALFMAQDNLTADGNITSGPLQESISKGLRWLSDNFDKVATDGQFDSQFPYMTLYGIERVATASGLRYLGKANWYESVASWVLKHQRPSGGWTRANSGNGSVNDTAFAIITLSRGQAPYVLSKLDYSASAATAQDWNLRPRDAANLVRFMGKAIERELNWQIVTMASPIEDWLAAPILYIEGGKALSFTDADKAKLRSYVEQGGLILAAADSSSKLFGEAIKKLGAELFPGREWRELPADHLIFNAQQFPYSGWKDKPIVLGLDNGVRELMVLLPFGDPPRWWQSNNTSSKEEFWQFGSNLHQYAAGRENLQMRGESHVILPDPSIKPARTVKLARIKYAGNWDPEPGGWQRAAAFLLNQHKIRLEIVSKDPAKEDLAGVQIAHLTGTDAVKLDPAAIKTLRIFVDAGGTLLIDCAGGSSAFAGSIEPVFREFFIEAKPEPLPPDHAMLTAADGNPIEISYRPFAEKALSNQKVESRLLCVKFKSRVAIIFSRNDLTAGLVGNHVDGIDGYSPATALQMAVGLVRSVGTK